MTDLAGVRAARKTDRDSLTSLLEALCRDRLPPGADFNINVGFFDAGLTSIALAAIAATLKEHGISITLLDFFKAQNVRHLAAELSRRLSESSSEESPTKC